MVRTSPATAARPPDTRAAARKLPSKLHFPTSFSLPTSGGHNPTRTQSLRRKIQWSRARTQSLALELHHDEHIDKRFISAKIREPDATESTAASLFRCWQSCLSR